METNRTLVCRIKFLGHNEKRELGVFDTHRMQKVQRETSSNKLVQMDGRMDWMR